MCCFTKAGTGQAWDKDGMTPTQSLLKMAGTDGRLLARTRDTNQIQIQIQIQG